MKYRNATQYISLNDAFKGDLVIGYADDNCLSKASLPMERGVGHIYSQSRWRGHKNFSGAFAPRPPQILYYFLAPPQSKICSAVLGRVAVKILVQSFENILIVLTRKTKM